MNEKLSLCECGCGEMVARKGNRFIYHHHRSGKKHTPEAKKKILKASKVSADARRGVPRSPEDCAAMSIAHIGIPHSPEHIAATVKGREESGTNDVMIGGNDLVWHHVSYDFLRPEALRIRIIRKFHGQIHSPKGLPVTKRGYSLID